MRAVAKCEYCGKEVLLPFRCKFCGGYFCEEHRLPENHNCPNLPKPLPLGPALHPAKDPYALTRPRKKREKKKKEIVVSEGPYHFKKATVPISSKEKQQKIRVPVKKIAVLSILLLALISLVVLPIYSTSLVQIDILNMKFYKGILGLFEPDYYSRGNISFSIRFTNKALYPIKLSNFDFKIILIDEESNESGIGYGVFAVLSQVPYDMLPQVGKGVTLSSNDYKQFKISTSIADIPVNFKTIKLSIEIDASCIWFSRHIIYEYPVIER